MSSSSLGIMNLPNQMYRKAIKKGSNYTIMVVGSSGIGKTAFINTLFQSDLIPAGDYSNESFRREQQEKHTVDIAVHRAEIEENGFRVTVNIVETNGFGDYCNNTDAWVPVIEFIDGQHESYLRQDLQPMRDDLLDGRVHVCLYFVRPTGHTLSELDIETMKRLSTRVNLIPVIPKADTFTVEELSAFKSRIMTAIQDNQIQLFELDPDSDEESNARLYQQCQSKCHSHSFLPIPRSRANWLDSTNGVLLRWKMRSIVISVHFDPCSFAPTCSSSSRRRMTVTTCTFATEVLTRMVKLSRPSIKRMVSTKRWRRSCENDLLSKSSKKKYDLSSGNRKSFQLT